MIDSKELRIGNKIRYTLHNLTVSALLRNGYVEVEEGIDGYLDEYEPIEISEQILIDAGFKKQEWTDDPRQVYYEYEPNDCIVFYFDTYTGEQNDCTANDSDHKGKCLYVHQLQNLYYALTGEELTIKL